MLSKEHSENFFSAQHIYVFLTTLICIQIYLIACSDGFYPIDEGAHFVNAKSMIENPKPSLDIWERFGNPWVFALPALGGHKVVKIFSVCLYLIILLICYKIAELEQIPHKEWVIPLIGLQPMFLDISFTCLSELPAALLIALSYYCYRMSRLRWSLILASLVFLFRTEMFFFSLIICVQAVRKRRFFDLPLVLIGPAIWFFSAWYWTGDPFWLPRELSLFSQLEKYQEGVEFSHYIASSPAIFGYIQVGFVIAGLFLFSKQTHKKLAVIYISLLGSLIINTLAANKYVHWTGSVGDLRYMTPISPFFGMVSLYGFSSLRQSKKFGTIVKRISPILFVLICMNALFAVKPHTLHEWDKVVMAFTEKAGSDTVAAPILSNYWASRFVDLKEKTKLHPIIKLSTKTFEEHTRAYVIWDPLLANSPFTQKELSIESIEKHPAVTILASVAINGRIFRLFLKDEKWRSND
jgi:hypothetical protein